MASLIGTATTLGCWDNSSTATLGQTVWSCWQAYAPTSSVTCTNYDLTWQTWVQTATRLWVAPAVTPEEARRLQQAEEARRHQQAEAERARRAQQRQASDRATALLLAHLTEQQQQDYTDNGYFEVALEDGQRTYRVYRGVTGNVKRLDGAGQEVMSYCIHPPLELPVADCLLAQKLLLEADEAAFLRVANARALL